MEEVIASLELQETEIANLVSEAKNFTPVGTKLRDATARDPVLREVLLRLLYGWKESDLVDSTLRPYAQQAGTLCAVQGVLLCEDHVVVPTSLRASVLAKLHKAHPGIVRMKVLARAHFYWPGMSADIEKVVRSCAHCAHHAAYPVKVPLAPWPDPERPWVRLHMDFAEPQKGNSFLVIVDAFSKYVDATFMKSATSQELVKYLRVVFRHFGRPEVIVSDNGSQFTSADFAQLCQEFDIVHLRSSPYSPQSNGLAEKTVGTLKRSLEIANQEALDEAVAAYNYTPKAALDGETPSRVFFGRALRSPFSVFRLHSRHPSGSSEGFQAAFDRHHGARLRSFSRGEKVVVELDKRRRVPATFLEMVGKVLARLQIDGRIVTRHLNQVWRRTMAQPLEAEPEDLVPEAASFQATGSPTPSTEAAAGPGVPVRLPLDTDHSDSVASESQEPEPDPPRRIQLARAAKKSTDYGALAGFRRLFGQAD